MKALIVIDFTNDFVDGNLPVGKPAIDIQNNIAELTKLYSDRGDFVVMAVDLHESNDAYHPETKLFPPHNIRGTRVGNYTVNFSGCMRNEKTPSTGWTKRDTAHFVVRI